MLSSRHVIKELEARGWQKVDVRGDHHQFKRNGKGVKVSVQHPVKDLSLLNVISIEKAAGFRLRPAH